MSPPVSSTPYGEAHMNSWDALAGMLLIEGGGAERAMRFSPMRACGEAASRAGRLAQASSLELGRPAGRNDVTPPAGF